MRTHPLPIAVIAGLLVAGTALGQSAPPAAHAFHAPGSPAPWTSWKNVPIPLLPAFHPKQPTRIKLKNGMTILLQEDHELPFITGFVIIRGGSRSEPAAKAGMLDLYAMAWRNSGTTKTPGDKYPNLFVFYGVPTPGHTPQQMRAGIHAELGKLKTQSVTAAQLEMYKTRARASILRSLDNNQGLAEELGTYQLRYGNWRMLFQQLNKINAVSPADILRVANQVFTAKNRTYAMIEYAPSTPAHPKMTGPAQPPPHTKAPGPQQPQSSQKGGR